MDGALATLREGLDAHLAEHAEMHEGACSALSQAPFTATQQAAECDEFAELLAGTLVRFGRYLQVRPRLIVQRHFC